MSKLHAAVQAHYVRALLCVAFWLAVFLGGSAWLGHTVFPRASTLAHGWYLAWVSAGWLLALNVSTWQFWRLDKRLAREGERVRVPETLLLLLCLFGGLPAGFAAMQLLRHKSAKRSFQWRLLLISLLWLAVLAAVVWGLR